MLLAILLDASLATVVIGLIAIIAGAVNNGSLEMTSYVFLGGLTGIVMIRKGDRLQVFVQAAFAVFVVNALVVTVFSLLGARDVRGVIELWFASAASAVGSGIAAVGTFAVLGSGVRDPDRLPAPRAREPVAAAAAPPAGRDAGHVPPLADGREPRRARSRGDRRRPARDPRRGVLPRRRQAREPARLHREPGRWREHPRHPGPRGQRRDRQAARRRRHRHRLQEQAAEGAHRVHPAAPRDRDHGLLLRPCPRARGRAVRRAGHGRGPPRRRMRSTSGRSATAARSRSRARPP